MNSNKIHKCITTLFFSFILFALIIINSSPSFAVEEIKDIPYKTEQNQTLLLDIYKPNITASKPSPVVVYIHGGSWTAGDKSVIHSDFHENVLTEFLKNGFTVVSIDYSLTTAENIHFPRPIQDCKDAVRWVRKNAQKYNFDPNNIGLWGTSAGAHLALLIAYSDDTEFAGTKDLKNYSSKVNYVINDFGPTELTKLLRPTITGLGLYTLEKMDPQICQKREDKLKSLFGPQYYPEKKQLKELCEVYSPLIIINKNAVPTLTFHGVEDKLVPVSQATLLHKSLNKNNVPNQLVEYKDLSHGFKNISSKNLDDLIIKTIYFAKKYSSIEN